MIRDCRWPIGDLCRRERAPATSACGIMSTTWVVRASWTWPNLTLTTVCAATGPAASVSDSPIRCAGWKLIDTYNDQAELYDMDDDPNEFHNVIEENRDTERALRRMMTAGSMEEKWRRG
jgi:hypothetical protein